MSKKIFQKNFAVTTDSQFLMKAFISSAEELGWTDGLRPGSSGKPMVFFNANKTSGFTKPGQYNYCDMCSNYINYKLPEQWNEAINALTPEIVTETYKVGDTFIRTSNKFGESKYLLSRIGDNKVILICIDKGQCSSWPATVGNCFSNDAVVKNLNSITEEEFKKLTAGFEAEFTKIDK